MLEIHRSHVCRFWLAFVNENSAWARAHLDSEPQPIGSLRLSDFDQTELREGKSGRWAMRFNPHIAKLSRPNPNPSPQIAGPGDADTRLTG